jgi:hypothetical protein
VLRPRLFSLYALAAIRVEEVHMCRINSQSEPFALSQASSGIETSYDGAIANGKGDVLLVPHGLNSIDDSSKASLRPLLCLPVRHDVFRAHTDDHFFPSKSSQCSSLPLGQRKASTPAVSY